MANYLNKFWFFFIYNNKTYTYIKNNLLYFIKFILCQRKANGLKPWFKINKKTINIHIFFPKQKLNFECTWTYMDKNSTFMNIIIMYDLVKKT